MVTSSSYQASQSSPPQLNPPFLVLVDFEIDELDELEELEEMAGLEGLDVFADFTDFFDRVDLCLLRSRFFFFSSSFSSSSFFLSLSFLSLSFLFRSPTLLLCCFFSLILDRFSVAED